MKKVSVSKIRGQLQEHLDSVHYTKEKILVLKNGKPWVEIHPTKIKKE